MCVLCDALETCPGCISLFPNVRLIFKGFQYISYNSGINFWSCRSTRLDNHRLILFSSAPLCSVEALITPPYASSPPLVCVFSPGEKWVVLVDFSRCQGIPSTLQLEKPRRQTTCRRILPLCYATDVAAEGSIRCPKVTEERRRSRRIPGRERPLPGQSCRRARG